MSCLFCVNSIFIGIGLGLIGVAYKYFWANKLPSLKNKHVLVTGGSLGIGKSFAIEAAKKGADVTIVARSVDNLEHALTEVRANASDLVNQKIQYLSLDLSTSYDKVEKELLSLEEKIGPVYMLVNCAGTSICSKLEDSNPKDIEYLMKLNILGTIFPTKALVARMKSRKEGKVVITASQAALVGIFGFTVYSSTKFALRGLAEALQMEVKPYNMTVTLALPPDTDTPGFAEEQKSKPQETRQISETAGLYSPEEVAQKMLQDALEGRFFSTVGLESAIMTTLCAGMSPCTSIKQTFFEVFTGGFLRFVGILILGQFNRIVSKCAQSRDQSKKTE